MLPGKYEREDGTIFDAMEFLKIYDEVKRIERERDEPEREDG